MSERVDALLQTVENAHGIIKLRVAGAGDLVPAVFADYSNDQLAQMIAVAGAELAAVLRDPGTEDDRWHERHGAWVR
jgi:hypothetical protein